MWNTSQLQRGRKVWGAWGFQVHGRASAPVVFSGEGDFESWGRGGDIGSRQRARPARRADKEAPTNRGSGGQQCRPPGESRGLSYSSLLHRGGDLHGLYQWHRSALRFRYLHGALWIRRRQCVSSLSMQGIYLGDDDPSAATPTGTFLLRPSTHHHGGWGGGVGDGA